MKLALKLDSDSILLNLPQMCELDKLVAEFKEILFTIIKVSKFVGTKLD